MRSRREKQSDLSESQKESTWLTTVNHVAVRRNGVDERIEGRGRGRCLALARRKLTAVNSPPGCRAVAPHTTTCDPQDYIN